MEEYVLVEDVEKLKEKLKEKKPPLDKWWPHFLFLAKSHYEIFPLFSGLAYIVTKDIEWANIFKKVLFSKINSLSYLDYSEGFQYHTWCFSNPIARWAIIYDWVFESGIFTTEERKIIEKKFIEFAFKHPYMVSQGRVISSENQIMSMCLCCGIIGYIFGYKRGENYLGKEIFSYALKRFPELIGLYPKGGYSLEGSTYMDSVVAPTVSFWCAFIEQLTGKDYFNKKFYPNNVSIKDILEMENKITGASGLLPPWDHYGFQKAVNKSPLVFLARKTNDINILKKIIYLDMWNENDLIAWGRDDKLWTILWWPEKVNIKNDKNIIFKNWYVENVCASFEYQEKKLRFFQYWDRSGYGYYVGRMQVNPNSIILESYGVPLLVDGIPDKKECSYFDYSLEKLLPSLKREKINEIISFHKEVGNNWSLNEWIKNWSYGCIGSSNSIIIDFEGWYTPEEEKEGKIIFFGETDAIKGIKSDVTSYYNPKYNLIKITRSSFFVRNSYIIVFDKIISNIKHFWTWQVFTRPVLMEKEGIFLIKTKEEIGSYIVPFENYNSSISHIKGYPSCLEKESYLLQFHSKGKKAEFKILFYPFTNLETGEDITDGWEIGFLENSEEYEKVWDMDLKLEKISFIDVPYYFDDRPYKLIKRKFLNSFKNKRVFLYFEKSVPEMRLWINKKEVKNINYDPLLPFIYEITKLLKDGVNEIFILFKNKDEKTIGGRCKLLEFCEKPFKTFIEEVGKNTYKISINGIVDTLLIDNEEEIITKKFKTDGWALFLGNESISGLNLSFLKTQDFSFTSNKKVDIEWKDNVFFINEISGNLEFYFNWKSKFIQIKCDNEKVIINGTPGIKLTFKKIELHLLFANEIFIKPIYNPEKDMYELILPKNEGKKEMDEIEKAIFFGFKKDTQSRKYLEKLLFHEDFLIRCASVLSLGKRGEKKSAKFIRKALKEEMKKENYPSLLNFKEIKDPEDKNLQERYVKRWRFIMCCIIALSEIGDKNSLPLIYKILKKKKDFYPVFVNAIKFLKNIRDRNALKILNKYRNYYEINTRIITNEAIKKLENLKREK